MPARSEIEVMTDGCDIRKSHGSVLSTEHDVDIDDDNVEVDDIIVHDGDESNSSYDAPWRLLGDVRNDRRSFPANCTSFLSPIAFTNLLLANSALSYDMLLLLCCCCCCVVVCCFLIIIISIMILSLHKQPTVFKLTDNTIGRGR